MTEKYGLKSAAVHGDNMENSFGSLSQPIYVTATYRSTPYITYEDYYYHALQGDGPHDWFLYSRDGNPNQMALENKLCSMTGAEACSVVSSGCSALASVFTTFLNTGDHVIGEKISYESTEFFLKEHLPKKYNIEASLVDMSDLDAVAAAIRPNTKLIHLEMPTNPLTNVCDLEKIAELAHAHNVLVSVDATFASPILIFPLKHGADLEVHSLTKYANGHGDAVGGCVLGRAELVGKIKETFPYHYGAVLSPVNAWLINRGLATLPYRMRQVNETAMKVAKYLDTNPGIRFVRYLGLESHPDHKMATKLMEGGYSGMMCFDVKGDLETHKKFITSLKMLAYTGSLGDLETLIMRIPDWYVTEDYPDECKPEFFRLSIGLEDADDIINDIDQALKAAGLI